MDVLCELYPVEMTAIFASKRIFAAAATGGARTAELPSYSALAVSGHYCLQVTIAPAYPTIQSYRYASRNYAGRFALEVERWRPNAATETEFTVVPSGVGTRHEFCEKICTRIERRLFRLIK